VPARIEGRSGNLKPGPYGFQENMSYDAVLDRLEKGVAPNVVMVTIPEGRSRRDLLLREVAAHLDQVAFGFGEREVHDCSCRVVTSVTAASRAC